jgi:H+/Cl- antiporter ClcA
MFGRAHSNTFVVAVVVAILIAAAAGSSSALFLWLLDVVTALHQQSAWLVWALPVLGGSVGWLYQRYGQGIDRGAEVLYEQASAPSTRIPLRMAPMVLVGTLLTHLGGGSAGREGTAVQMSGAITDTMASWFPAVQQHRRWFLLLGIAAGFAAVFGTPLAGAVFALEIIPLTWRERRSHILPAAATAYGAHGVCLAWGIHHTAFPQVIFDAPYHNTALWAIGIGVCAIVVAHGFHRIKGGIENIAVKHIVWPWLRPVVGGSVVVVCFMLFPLRDHAGLSLPLLLQSFTVTIVWYHVIAKVLLTAITLGSGFKGGEVTPLFVMGATMGSALSVFGGTAASMAAMGMAAVFAAATRTPVASTLLACEVFGWEGLPWYAVACGITFARDICMGRCFAAGR